MKGSRLGRRSDPTHRRSRSEGCPSLTCIPETEIEMNILKSIAIGAAAIAMATSIATAAGNKLDIVETASGAGNFNTLVTAVKAAGLVDTLKGPGPFTV